jgi:signal transduction histidine kinase
MLLWLSVRCGSFFASAGAFLVCFNIIWMTVFGFGHFGDNALSLENRIASAQANMLVVAVGALVLAALFAERREAEARLTRSNMMLERERDNKLMNVQAALASVAHELRQPLTAISINASAAKRFFEMTPPRHDLVRETLSQLSDASRHASDVLEGVRALFKRSDEGRELLDVNEIILEVLRSMEGRFKDHEVATHVELASKLPRFHGHKGQLREVVSNLFLNAIQAMDVMVDRRRELRMRTELHERGTIAVTVKDSGPGISQESLTNIFKPFVTTKAQGTGLGLAISQSIIESHGGRITVSSDGESGALFQVILPISSAVDISTAGKATAN